MSFAGAGRLLADLTVIVLVPFGWTLVLARSAPVRALIRKLRGPLSP